LNTTQAINTIKYQISSVNMVKTLPFQDIQVPSPGFGAMGLSFGLGSNLSLEEAEPVLLKAIELGCTFWDTAVSLVRQFL
jgi:predicted aldo/keto reductase-like oxidoreductase